RLTIKECRLTRFSPGSLRPPTPLLLATLTKPIAKDPIAMPALVTTTQAAFLTGPQIGEAVHLVCKLFNKAELKELVRIQLDFDLFVEAASENDPLQTIAYDLLGYLNRHGLVHKFVEALCTSRPRDDGLRQFAFRVTGTPGTATPGEQVTAFETAILT